MTWRWQLQINRVLQGFERYGVPQDILTAEEAWELLRLNALGEEGLNS